MDITGGDEKNFLSINEDIFQTCPIETVHGNNKSVKRLLVGNIDVAMILERLSTYKTAAPTCYNVQIILYIKI